jgi:aldehyde:ferredoxin oxidoreductase
VDLLPAPEERYEYAHNGELHKKAAAMFHVMSSTGTCLFAYTSHPTGFIPDFLTAVTGREHDVDACFKIGERIEVIRHLFTLREGIDPLRAPFNRRALGDPPLQIGPTTGVTIDEQVMIDDYLDAMDWDRDSARPRDRKLRELGLLELVTAHGPQYLPGSGARHDASDHSPKEG